MKPAADNDVPILLFGAFDRHNFGDVLFPHIVAALLDGRTLRFAGLAGRDLRACGGHHVESVAALAAAWGARPIHLFHVGGELLTCDAWQAAAMLLPPEQAAAIIARLDGDPPERLAWARRQLGMPGLAPYALERRLFAGAARVIYNAVGGVDLGRLDAAMRDEVLAKLAAADEVSVRDRETLAQLHAAGIAARLLPDPAVLVVELFGRRIDRHARSGEIATILGAFPKGYLAVQFSADFGDDRTLAEIAAQLDATMLATGYGVAFFRAGAAPWHDDMNCYRRVAARLRATAVRIVESLDLWDICALIANSRAYCGSSLHGRIVAMAWALPRVNFHHPAGTGRAGKTSVFAATWEQPDMPGSVAVDEIATAIGHALASDPERRRQTARQLAASYRRGFAPIRAALD